MLHRFLVEDYVKLQCFRHTSRAYIPESFDAIKTTRSLLVENYFRTGRDKGGSDIQCFGPLPAFDAANADLILVPNFVIRCQVYLTWCPVWFLLC